MRRLLLRSFAILAIVLVSVMYLGAQDPQEQGPPPIRRKTRSRARRRPGARRTATASVSTATASVRGGPHQPD